MNKSSPTLMAAGLGTGIVLSMVFSPHWSGGNVNSLQGGQPMLTKIKSPDFPDNFAWINTDRPLKLADQLKGQVVLLDFWTYCCINCMHVLGDLAYLENKYADQPFAVIGVHSNKFDNESSPANIRAAVKRYKIRHPVIVDERMQIWRAFGVHAWPTFILIDPEGHKIATLAGEGQREALDAAIASALQIARSEGTLAKSPLGLLRQPGAPSAGGLTFPGKVLADAPGKRIFISDSSHNRIVITAWPDDRGHARQIAVIGSGQAGSTDGAADRATFNDPQGLALIGNTLYVADTKNHLIRTVDLRTMTVTTILGTGRQSYDRTGGKRGTAQGLSSPWDLATDGKTLYIAMAGLHQLWKMDLESGIGDVLAGSGSEGIVDGPSLSAALAQPSGLALIGKTLYFADSEVSGIRGVDLDRGQVFTIIGRGLFEFGDVDGNYPAARMQHPLGLTALDDGLLVADTYNHKIKRIDLKKRSATTLIVSSASPSPDKLRLYEPGGLSLGGDTLVVADTNNHRIVLIDVKINTWRELVIRYQPQRGLQGETR